MVRRVVAMIKHVVGAGWGGGVRGGTVLATRLSGE